MQRLNIKNKSIRRSCFVVFCDKRITKKERMKFFMDNTGKRDILIFPKFKNIDKIQMIRNKYDPLANLIAPHITLIFPFSDDISNEELIEKLSNLLANFRPFNIAFKGISLSDDNYIFLNCVNGRQKIIQLHDEIYKQILPTHLNTSIKYIPHITLGQSDNIKDFSLFEDEFKTIVDTISIELIGKNEESIILKKIKLKT